MSPGLADAVGLVGSAVLVGGYAYSNMAAQLDLALFNALNLVGALLLIVSLWVHFNLASMMLEIVWSAIAALGLAKSLRGKTLP